MPTPNTYRKLARWLKPRKVVLWISALIGFGLIAAPLVLVALGRTGVFPTVPIALGILVLVVSWDMICIESWFSDKPPGLISRKLQAAFPRTYASAKIGLEWYASFFLVLWFTAGVVMTVVMLTEF